MDAKESGVVVVEVTCESKVVGSNPTGRVAHRLTCPLVHPNKKKSVFLFFGCFEFTFC